MKYIVCLGILASFLGGVVCPGHHSYVSCFHCRGWSDVPSCLHSKHTCHSDEVCEVVYGSSGVTIGCRKERDCQHDTQHTSASCAAGAYHTYKGCEKCCKDSTCVEAQAAVLRARVATTIAPRIVHGSVHCPVMCSSNMCHSNVRYCDANHFCELKATAGYMFGVCMPNSQLSLCSTDHARNDPLCAQDNLSLIHGTKKCVYCCLDSNCAMSHFRPTTTQTPTTETSHTFNIIVTTPAPTKRVVVHVIYPTTRRPVIIHVPVVTNTVVYVKTFKPVATTTTRKTTTTATTTVTTTQLPNPLLYGNCKNLIESNGCDPINTKVCTTDLGVRVCADSCGLCGLIKSRFTNNIICADHLISNECQVLQKTQDICNHNLAMFTCPKSCNICSSVLDGLIKEILTPTTVSTTGTTVTMTSTQTGTSSTAQTSSTNIVTTQTTSPTPTSASPSTSTLASTSATSSSLLTISRAVHVVTRNQLTTQQVTNNICIDQLQGMKCVDLVDICHNSLGSRICQKFCGLCGNVTAVVSPSPSP